MTFYMIGGIERDHKIEIFGQRTDIKLTWADGMIGVAPVFESLEAAEKYTGGNCQITRIEVENEDEA